MSLSLLSDCIMKFEVQDHSVDILLRKCSFFLFHYTENGTSN